LSSSRNRVIVFIGPQGSGKTTLAKQLTRELRAQGFRPCIVKIIDYTILHLWFIRFVNRLVRDNVVLVKFYENLPPQRSASPAIFRRLLPLLVFSHMLGLVMSLLKLKLFKLMKGCGVIVDDEGFIFKQLPDLLFLVAYSKPSIRELKLARMFSKFSVILVRRTLRRGVIVRVKAPYSVLRERYARRGRIEPRSYIEFQDRVHDIVLRHVSVLYNYCRHVEVDGVGDVVWNLKQVFNFITTDEDHR
jgi:ribose 1,5-bisphosphokinase PhnN